MKFSDIFQLSPFTKSGKNFLFGTDPQMKEYQNFSPQQQNYLQMLLSSLNGPTQGSFDFLNSLYGDEGFADYERPYQEQFQQQIMPSIIEKFAGAGAKSSSGLNQALAQAGRGLSTDLAAQRGNLRMQGINALQNYGQLGLGRQTTPYVQQGQEGQIGNIIKLLAMAGGL